MYRLQKRHSEAAENFVKRYFRSENPAIGASFAGVLDYKAQEVLSKYWKSSSIESSLSLDDILQRSDDSRQSTFANHFNISISTAQRMMKKFGLLNKSFKEVHEERSAREHEEIKTRLSLQPTPTAST